MLTPITVCLLGLVRGGLFGKATAFSSSALNLEIKEDTFPLFLPLCATAIFFSKKSICSRWVCLCVVKKNGNFVLLSFRATKGGEIMGEDSIRDFFLETRAPATPPSEGAPPVHTDI